MHQSGSQGTERDEFLPMQRLDLVSLQPLCHVAQNHFTRGRAAGHQGPKTVFADAQDHRIFNCLHVQRSEGFPRQQRSLAKPLARASRPYQRSRAIGFNAFRANFTLENNAISANNLFWFREGTTGRSLNALHRAQHAEIADRQSCEGKGLAQCIGH